MAEIRCARSNVILLTGAAEPWNKALRRYGCCTCRTLWKRDKIAAHQVEARCTRFVITEEELQDLDTAADSVHEPAPPASSSTPPPAAPAAPAAPTPSPSPAPAVPAAATNGVAVPADVTSPPPAQAVEEIVQEATATPMTRNSSPAELASQTASPSPRSQADVAATDCDAGDGGRIFAASVPPAPPSLCNGFHAPDAASRASVAAAIPAPTTTPTPPPAPTPAQAPDAAPVLASVPVPVPTPVAPVVAVAAAVSAPSPLPPPPAPKPVGPVPTYWAPALGAQGAESLKQVLTVRHPDGHMLFTGEASEIVELCNEKPKALSSDVLWVVAGKMSEEECVSPRGDGSQEADDGANEADEGLWVLHLPTLLQAQGGFFERYTVVDLDKGALHNLADHYTASKKVCSTDERIPKPTVEYVQLPPTYKGEVLKVNDVYFSRPASDAGKLIKLCFREEEATPEVFEANTGRDRHLRIDKALQKEGLKTYEMSDADGASILQHVPAVKDYLVTYLDSTSLSAVRLRRKDGGDDGPTLGHVGPDLLGTWYTAAGPRASKVHQACLDKAVAALT